MREASQRRGASRGGVVCAVASLLGIGSVADAVAQAELPSPLSPTAVEAPKDPVPEETESAIEDIVMDVDPADSAMDATGTPDTTAANGDDGVEAATAQEEVSLLDSAKFTLMQEWAVGMNSPRKTVNNRSSFRVEYERHFLDDFYLRFDTKLTGFWKNDHRARAEDRDLLFATNTREAFLQFSHGRNSVKLGRQILIWGESDAGAITDVISPRNYSELFFISLEESRIGQFMATLDHFGPSGDWSYFYVPDAQFNQYPEPGTAYYVDAFEGFALRGGDVDKGEYGLRWKRTFGRSDVALMAASLVDNDFAYRAAGLVEDGRPLLRRTRERFEMLGGTFNFATNDWIFSGELAWKTPKRFASIDLTPVDKDLLEASFRVERSLGKSGSHSVSLELTNSHVLDWTSAIAGTPRNSATAVLGWNNTFFNDNFTVNYLAIYSRPYTSLQNLVFTSYKINDKASLNIDAFYLDVADDRSALRSFRRDNNVVFRFLYQF
ncbi:MAG: hypothetical protein E6Q50_09405 [Lysobacter sp.]|nr:MAG: hypothetical protein E6Q50_09405 [Lysobacter sp.]